MSYPVKSRNFHQFTTLQWIHFYIFHYIPLQEPGTSAGRLAHALLCNGFVVRELRVGAQRGLQRQDVPRDLLLQKPGHPKGAREVASRNSGQMDGDL